MENKVLLYEELRVTENHFWFKLSREFKKNVEI